MQAGEREQAGLDPLTRKFYKQAMAMLGLAQIPYLVGGAYALAHYTGIERHTKDFDIFVMPRDAPRVLATFEEAGFPTELTHPHWLGKVHLGDDFLDVIFASGNGLVTVDEEWFEHAPHAEVFDTPVRLCPAEEVIWSKGFVMERERFDGADVAHLLHGCARELDWQRLLRRFGPHWRLLLCHLTLFGFIYPGERSHIPAWVMKELTGRLLNELESDHALDLVCQGTLLSRAQYLVDTQNWGYRDARLPPIGTMTGQDIAHWTEAIAHEKPVQVQPSFSSEGDGEKS